jgi:lysophospholipase L1-like esterase
LAHDAGLNRGSVIPGLRSPNLRALAAALLVVGCAAASVGHAHAHAQPMNPAAIPVSRMEDPGWRKRFEQKAIDLRSGPIDLVFYGDSIVGRWDQPGTTPETNHAGVWKRFYGDRRAIDLGFGGDSTDNLMWRVQNGEADGILPRVAVVMIGLNNLGAAWSAENTADAIAAITHEIERRSPTTQILVLGILPSGISAAIQAKAEAVNAGLRARFSAEKTIRFLDLGQIFLKEGQLRGDLFIENRNSPPGPFIHPNAAGQERIFEAIEPIVAAALGDRNHAASP